MPRVGTARQVVRAATPMLRVVSGGLDRLPAEEMSGSFARGRAMIVVAALLAVGLVYVNVGSLESGDGFGKYSQRVVELQRQNMQLRSRVAQLGSTDRIQKLAAKLGLTMPIPEQYSYLRSRQRDAFRATKVYTSPMTTPPPAPQTTTPAINNTVAPTLAVGAAPVGAAPVTPGTAQGGQTTPQTTTGTPGVGAGSPAGGTNPATGGN